MLYYSLIVFSMWRLTNVQNLMTLSLKLRLWILIEWGTGIKAVMYRWRCMPTATPRTAGRYEQYKKTLVLTAWGGGRIALVFVMFYFLYVWSEMGLKKNFENGTWCQNLVSKEASMGRKHARLCFIPICQCVPEILHFERFFACLSAQTKITSRPKLVTSTP